MNLDAKKLFGLLATADGGCGPCVRKLFSEFVGLFPQYRNEAADYWASQYDYPFDEDGDQEMVNKLRGNP